MNSIIKRNNKFNEIREIVETYKDKLWHEWLEYRKTLQCGKQGMVGVFIVKNTQHKILFKLSQYINYLAHHEYTIMSGLEKIHDYCPHFCRTYGIIKCSVNPHNRRKGNPFEETSENIEKEVLLIEYIQHAPEFNELIIDENINDNIIYSVIKQVLLAISIAQTKCSFSHYDLHSYNILMQKCPEDTVFMYVLDSDNIIVIPTFGYYPIIIDFGFGYIKDMENGPMWASLAHTNVGFMSNQFDWVADPKLFLVTVSDDIKKNRGGHTAKIFRNIVKNIFECLEIDWEAGWDSTDDQSALNYVLELIKSHSIYSEVFQRNDFFCLDIIQSMVVLPLEKQKIGQIDDAYIGLQEEFAKIERYLHSDFYSLYILKRIVDLARIYRPDYMIPETRPKIVRTFKNDVFEIMRKVVKFYPEKDVNLNAEKMLCCLYVLSKSMEGVFYKTVKNQMREKKQAYKNLKFKSTIQILGCVEANIPSKYNYTCDTNIIVYDIINETMTTLNPSHKTCKRLNRENTMYHGCILSSETDNGV